MIGKISLLIRVWKGKGMGRRVGVPVHVYSFASSLESVRNNRVALGKTCCAVTCRPAYVLQPFSPPRVPGKQHPKATWHDRKPPNCACKFAQPSVHTWIARLDRDPKLDHPMGCCFRATISGSWAGRFGLLAPSFGPASLEKSRSPHAKARTPKNHS